MNKHLLKTGQTEPVKFTIYIGFFAGLFGSIIRFFAYHLKFTTFDNGFLIYDMFTNLSGNKVLSLTLGTISFVLFSILCSFIYMLLFRTKQGTSWGCGLGIGSWIVLFLVLPSQFNWPTRGIVMQLETQIFELCLFIVWGLFIGYSIAFEFTDEASHEPIYAK